MVIGRISALLIDHAQMHCSLPLRLLVKCLATGADGHLPNECVLAVASLRLVVLCSVVEQKVPRLKAWVSALVKVVAWKRHHRIANPPKVHLKYQSVEKVTVVASSNFEIPVALVAEPLVSER